jgi:hypothetical protein
VSVVFTLLLYLEALSCKSRSVGAVVSCLFCQLQCNLDAAFGGGVVCAGTPRSPTGLCFSNAYRPCVTQCPQLHTLFQEVRSVGAPVHPRLANYGCTATLKSFKRAGR